MRTLLFAVATATLGTAAVPAAVQAQSTHADRQYQRDLREADRNYRDNVRDERRDYREERRDYRRDRRQAIRDWRQYRNLDYNRPDPYYGNYYADRYYRDGRYYQQRRLTRADRIYRGNDGRYYCRRSDGTTGLILGAIGGGLLGNTIAKGDSNLLGTIIGGGAGALIGRELDRGNVRCR